MKLDITDIIPKPGRPTEHHAENVVAVIALRIDRSTGNPAMGVNTVIDADEGLRELGVDATDLAGFLGVALGSFVSEHPSLFEAAVKGLFLAQDENFDRDSMLPGSRRYSMIVEDDNPKGDNQ